MCTFMISFIQLQFHEIFYRSIEIRKAQNEHLNYSEHRFSKLEQSVIREFNAYFLTFLGLQRLLFDLETIGVS